MHVKTEFGVWGLVLLALECCQIPSLLKFWDLLALSGEADHPQNPNQQPNQKEVIQQQFVTFKPHTHAYTSPVLKKGILGNFEPKEPEPPGVPGGPGEGAKPFVLGPEYKDTVQASIKEFGFNMVASDMISLDRTISDIRHEE